MDSKFKVALGNNLFFVSDKNSAEWAIVSEDNLGEIVFKGKTIRNYKLDTFDLLVLNTTRDCNLNCVYCYADKKKEYMHSKIAVEAISQALDLSKGMVNVVFHGGEPLLNLDMIAETVEIFRHNNKVSFSIQTNGTLIDKDIVDFFKRYNISPSFSLDGTELLHNITRRYSNGTGTFKDVLRGINLTKEFVPINLITVVTKYTVNYLPEIYDYFTKIKVRSALFSPMIPNNQKNLAMLANSFTLFDSINTIIDDSIEKMISNKYYTRIRNLSDALIQILFPKISETCLICGGGYSHPLLSVDINGDVYPCDNFLGKKNFSIGNVTADSLSVILERENIRLTRSIHKTECTFCNWGRFCGGGCPYDSYSLFGDANHKSSYCNYYRNLFPSIIKIIPKLVEYNLLEKILAES